MITAASVQDAIGALTARQLFPVRVAPAEERVPWAQRLRRRRIRPQQLSTFYSQLADLLKAGVPLLRSLELLQNVQPERSPLATVIRNLREQVADGRPLAEAMRRQHGVFSPLVISMVRAGEEGGFLEDVLKRTATFIEHQQELKNRVTGALAYPCFLLAAGTLIVTAMLVWFVPKFAPIFARLEQLGELPWATVSLLAISNGIKLWGLSALVALGLGAIALSSWIRTDRGQYLRDSWLLRLWGLGNILKSLAISRFCRILGTLLRNGVPILQSLQIAKDATGNRVLSEAIAQAAEHVTAGKSLAKPLAASGQFPPEIVEMIAVGEEANNLEQVLIDIADSLEARTYRRLELAVRLLEPVMLLIMAALVLYVVAALLLPVFKMSGAI